jgi:hypothetical protein
MLKPSYLDSLHMVWQSEVKKKKDKIKTQKNFKKQNFKFPCAEKQSAPHLSHCVIYWEVPWS